MPGEGDLGDSLEQTPPVHHSKECGQECPSHSRPKPWGPEDSPNSQRLLQFLLCLELWGTRRGAHPRAVPQERGAGALVNPNGVHRHVLILLWGVVRPCAQGIAAADGKVRRADGEWLAIHPGYQPARLAQLWL